jgi:hypothetical protein
MGEEKRRRMRGEYPTGAGADPEFNEFSNRLRRTIPGVSSLDIGLSWMRAQGSGGISTGKPEEFPVHAGCVVMHLVFGTATLNAALPLGDLDELLRIGRPAAPLEDLRNMIVHAMARNRHLESACGRVLMCAAFTLAFTGELEPALRTLAAEGFLRIAHSIETFIDEASGQQAFNFRLLISDQRDPPVVIPLAEVPFRGALPPSHDA